MRVSVNGEEHDIPTDATVAAVVTSLVGVADRGVAVAVNSEVVPRAWWAGTRLGSGDRIEVLTAAQGG